MSRHICLPLHAFVFSEQIQASETENSNRCRLWLAMIPVRIAKNCNKTVISEKNEDFFGILLHLVVYCVIIPHISKDIILCN